MATQDDKDFGALASGQASSGEVTHDLINALPHARGQKVQVDGTDYQIDERGVMKGVKEAHAKKLLQNKKVWAKHDPRHPVTIERPSRQVTLIDDKGRHFHADRSATRKQTSMQPLLADDSKVARDLPHAVDSEASQRVHQPLIDDKLNVARGPDASHGLPEAQALARGYQKKADGDIVKPSDLGGSPEADIASDENASGKLNLPVGDENNVADSDTGDSGDESTNNAKPKGKRGHKH